MEDHCIYEDCCICKDIHKDDLQGVEDHIANRDRLSKTTSTCDGKNCIYDPNDVEGSRKRIRDKADKLGKDKIRDHFQ